MQFRSSQISIPDVTKNFIIINILFFIGKFAAGQYGISLDNILAMFYFKSESFKPWQVVSHIFMHGDFRHLLFNMFGLFMFGSVLERMWGPKRFVQFYFFSALGAALLHFAIIHFQVDQLLPLVNANELAQVINEGREVLDQRMNYTNETMAELNSNYNGAVVGASGAIFGLLVAFAMYNPNKDLFLMFVPVPIKAKYFVLGYAAFELFSGISRILPGIAHFAHLGGALFGFLLVTYWNKNNRKSFY